MTQARRYAGEAVSEGLAVGELYQADAGVDARAIAYSTPAQVQAAFAAVAAERGATADRLRAAGRADQADILAISALMAADPVLVDSAVTAMRAGATAAAAVHEAVQAQATAIAAIPSPELAERASDVRQVGVAVLEYLAGGPAARPVGDFILIRQDVAAADLIDLAEHGLVGAASVAGGATSHAAIIARGLGIAMITGVDAAALDEPTGTLAILDADGGELTAGPDDAERLAAQGKTASSHNATSGRHPGHAGRPRTADGQEVVVMCNVASVAETRRGLAEGAAGVGLLRTEIPFTSSRDWPPEADHLARLTPILDLLAGRVATVRLLDFSGDKVPPFLKDSRPAPTGLAALLTDPQALRSQLRAALTAGRAAELAILIPMVSSLGEVEQVRGAVRQVATELGLAEPYLGIMVEIAATAAAAERFAPAVDFFSIGTNDLTSDVLGLDRQDQATRPDLAADPRVLALIEHVVESARAASISVSVCGDAAANPLVLPLLIGLGVRAVSVPAAYVQRVRERVGELDARVCLDLAAKTLRASTIEEARELMRHAQLS